MNQTCRERQQATFLLSRNGDSSNINPSIDDHGVVRRMQQEFHGKLATLQSQLCSICLERHDFSTNDHAGACNRCHNDSLLPKLYSAADNMDPGPVPPELTVTLKLFSHIYCMESYHTLHGTHHCTIESQ